MGTNILGIGQSALAAAQVGITTTGHNIANANTPGYSRQIVSQKTAGAQAFGYGFAGQGVDVANISRVYNDFIANQVVSAQSSKTEYDVYHSQLDQVNSTLADSTTGIAATMQDYFSSLQQMNAHPGDAASRQGALSSSQVLVSRINSVAAQVASVGDNINQQLKSGVDSVNSYAQQLAKLNEAISAAINSTGTQPNDLMDQRDQLVADLSKQIKTTVVKQGSSYNMVVGNGLPLVVGATVTPLTTVPVVGDPTRLAVGYASNGKVIPLSDNNLPGGAVGGLLQFRSQSLDPIRNQLGLLAANFASTMNSQNNLGQDLIGQPGRDIFSVSTPQVIASASNTGNNLVQADIVDARALTTSDYKVDFDGTNYTVQRLSDGSKNTSSTLPVIVDGVSFKLKSGALVAGDSYTVKPVANAAQTIKLAINDPSKFALALPIRSSASATNTGSGVVSGDSVTSGYAAAPLASSVKFDFNATAPAGFTVTPPSAVTVDDGSSVTTYPAGSSVPFTEGASLAVGGASFKITGTPKTGDVFSLGPNTNGVSDNRNGLVIANLQNNGTMGNGTVTYQEAYAQLVSAVGSKTNELQVLSKSQDSLLANASNAQQSESGVNLDEEAANLLRYQQAYQAAGKVMQTASSLFDVILSLGR